MTEPKRNAEGLLDAPCIFCGYNSHGYWQTSTHNHGCPWVRVGGKWERWDALPKVIREHWRIVLDGRQPTPNAKRNAEGKTPGQVAYENSGLTLIQWEDCPFKSGWEIMAQAVLDEFGHNDREFIDALKRQAAFRTEELIRAILERRKANKGIRRLRKRVERLKAKTTNARQFSTNADVESTNAELPATKVD